MNPDDPESPQPPDTPSIPGNLPPIRIRRKSFLGAKSLRTRVKKGTDHFRGPDLKPLPTASNPASLAYHAQPYLAHLTSRNYSPCTTKGREQALRRFLAWTCERGLHLAGEVSLPVLEAYQAWLWRYRKTNGKPLAIGSQRDELLALKDYFRWLVRQRVILSNPASELSLPREEKRLPPDAQTARQTAAGMSVPDVTDLLGIRDRAMLEIFYSTGVRRAELASLRLEDLNYERATLRVFGKGKKERVVPVGTRAMHWLVRYLEDTRPRLVIRQEVREMFLSGLGTGFRPEGIGRHITEIMRRADIAKGGPHILRHTCATHMLEGGADLRVIQQLLGHANADTTSLYAQVSITHLQQVHARCHPAERTGPNSPPDVIPGDETPTEPPVAEA